jgi:hypothetical protein
MPVKYPEISRMATEYARIPLSQRNSARARETLDKLNFLIKGRLLAISDSKESLVYHMHELETLHSDGKAGRDYYNRVHDAILQKINELEEEQKELARGVKQPETLAIKGPEIHLNRVHVIVFVELLLVLTAVAIYYYLKSGM